MDWLSATFEDRVQLAGSGSTMFVEGHLEPGVDSWDVMGPEGIVRFRQTTTTPKEARRGLFTGGATLEASALQHLLVLLLAHALAPLLD